VVGLKDFGVYTWRKVQDALRHQLRGVDLRAWGLVSIGPEGGGSLSTERGRHTQHRGILGLTSAPFSFSTASAAVASESSSRKPNVSPDSMLQRTSVSANSAWRQGGCGRGLEAPGVKRDRPWVFHKPLRQPPSLSPQHAS
jgi:hypothetical protein